MNNTTNTETNNCAQTLTKDVEIARMLAKILINRLTRIINSAENGEVTLDLASENNNDLIMVNLDLPDNDNYEVTCVIKDKNTTTSENLKIPAITLTAHAKNASQKNITNKNHMINCLLNPLDHDNLKIALKYYLFK